MSLPILLERAVLFTPYRFRTGLKLESMRGWRPAALQVAFCFGQSTRLVESGVAALALRSSGA